MYTPQFGLRPGAAALISLIFFLIPKQSRIPFSPQLERQKSHAMSDDRVVKVSEDLPSSTSKIQESRIQASMLSLEKEHPVPLSRWVDSNKEITCTHIYFYWLEYNLRYV